jgi:4-hydroxy-4-methyl-2-oxoglutarate aldolase
VSDYQESAYVTDDLIASYRALGVATVYECNQEEGALDAGIQALMPGDTMVGRALTVALSPLDNRSIHRAVAQVQPGDVIVCDHRSLQAGPWGAVLTQAAMYRGCVGLVIDGYVRDSDAIKQLGFPVFCRGRSIKGTAKAIDGWVGSPVVVGGVRVQRGDLVMGDGDGVCIVPASRARKVLRDAQAREERENDLISQIASGVTTWDLLGLTDKVEITAH